MKLADLDLFVRTADSGNITAAARELDISPAAASAAIKRLEQQIDNSLFIRSTRKLRLTAAGERFLPHCRRVLAELIEAKFDLTGRSIGGAMSPLLDLSRGHPQRASFLAHHVWEATPAGQSADEDAWITAFDVAMLRSKHEFVAVEAGLEPGQRKMARLLAWGEPPYGASAGRLGLPKGTATKATAALERRSLAWRPYDEELELVDPLFAAWIRFRDPQP